MSILSFSYRIFAKSGDKRIKFIVITTMTIVTLHSLTAFAVRDAPSTVVSFANSGISGSSILLLIDSNQLGSYSLSKGLLGPGSRANCACSNQCLHRCRRACNSLGDLITGANPTKRQRYENHIMFHSINLTSMQRFF